MVRLLGPRLVRAATQKVRKPVRFQYPENQTRGANNFYSFQSQGLKLMSPIQFAMEIDILLGPRLVPKSKVDPVFLELFREPVFQFPPTHTSEIAVLTQYFKMSAIGTLLPYTLIDLSHAYTLR